MLIQNSLEGRKGWREKQVDDAAAYAETVRFVNFVRDQMLT